MIVKNFGKVINEKKFHKCLNQNIFETFFFVDLESHGVIWTWCYLDL